MNRSIAVVGFLAAIALLPGLGLRDPWPPDEPRFILAAQEMLESGQWWITTRAGEVYSDKPPIFMWVEACLLRFSGSQRLAFQLPSLFASLGVLWLTYDLGRRLWGRRTGLWAAGILATTVQFVIQARSGQIDALLSLFTTLGLYGLLRHALLGPAWGWYLGGFAAMGLGVLTKGVGFLPLLAILPIFWANHGGWRHLGSKMNHRWWLGPLVMVTVVAAWVVPLWVVAEQTANADLLTYRNDLLFQQTVQRYVDPPGHIKPFGYFLTSVIPWAWLPVSLALPWLIPGWWRRFRRQDSRYLVLLGWILTVLLFFSLSDGKRGVYLLPTLPALALAAAPFGPLLWRSKRLNILAAVVAGLISGLLAVAATQGPRLAEHSVGELATPLATIAGIGFLALIVVGPRRGLVGLLTVLSAVWLIVGFWVYPSLNDIRSGKFLMATIGDQLATDAQLAIVDWREQMVLQADRPILHFGYRTAAQSQAEQVADWLSIAGPSDRALVPEKNLAPCFFTTNERPVKAHRQSWYLLSSQNLTGKCSSTQSVNTTGGGS